MRTPALRPLTGNVPGYTQTLALRPESAALARRSVRTTLACWGLESLADDAELIASELVTNAVEHARPQRASDEDPGRCRLTLERPDDATVWLTVADSSPRNLVRRSPTTDDDTGRGLTLVEAVSSRWTAQRSRAGKVVWAELRVTA
ncbi:ATP-binding protein [Streptomyces sp. CG1]|uniref:ATP-binding protein n=1 Tax=Streptomyces sp. CG1 TaxID=1287523 RepID=UPI0034E2345C